MAFSSFGTPANAMGGGAAGAGGVTVGSDLETIQTEALGFLSVAGDAKVRLTSAWSPLPAPTSSLLSIASRKGLVAAAGPDHIILATTESVRKAFEAPKEGDSDIRPFQPQLKIPMGMRVSQLAFTADENYLILSAENGGGLAVYEVQSLLQNSTSSAFELSTNGEALRAVVPNPTPEKAELCAIVTNGGNLHMANLKDRAISGPLKNQVSSLSWSSKGKQLCAGLGNGAIAQMTPEGENKAEIPKPSNLGDCHVSSLTWLENNLFLAIYHVNNDPSASSTYYLITRQPPSDFKYQKLSDPVQPFNFDKAPHHSILRLRDFPPSLQDLLIVSSTASTDIGLLSRSQTPLATDKPAESITGVFTTTELLDDTKRPTLPMTDDMEDSIPVGIALDLSSKDRVYKPIPSDEELEESPNPLPGLWVFTHEGLLCAWWLVYTDSIKQATPYPGLTAVGGSNTSAPAAAQAPAPAAASASASPFSAFGQSSQLGQKPASWATTASGTPEKPATPSGGAFGSSSTPAFGKTSSFGQSSQLGIRTSPWSTGGTGSAFGQSGFAGFAKGNNQSAFASAATSASPTTAPASGGFAGFARKGGFSALSGNNNNSGSPFGSATPSSGGAFGSGSSFATTSKDSVFSSKDPKPSLGSFGSTPLKIESTFKPDPAAKEDTTKPAAPTGSLFGSGFGSALNDAASQPAVTTPGAKDEDMDAMESSQETPQAKSQTQPQSMFSSKASPESTTPTTTPAPNKFTLSTTPATTSVFGQPSKLGGSGGIFGSKSGISSTSGSGSLFGSKTSAPASSSYPNIFGSKPDTAKTAPEKQGNQGLAKDKEDAPLPPDTTSKATYPIGDSSSSSAASNAPNPFATASSTSQADPKSGPNVGFLQSLKSSNTVKSNPFASAPKSNPFAPSSAQPSKSEDAPLPPDFTKAPSKAVPDAPLPPDPVTTKAQSKANDAPLPPDFVSVKAPSKTAGKVPSVPEPSDAESDLEDDVSSEGSGTDIGKDLSPTIGGHGLTSGLSSQSAFGSQRGTASKSTTAGQEAPKTLFGEIRNAPVFPRPAATSPRSPSPVRGAIPNRVLRPDATRSVSLPGMASQVLRPAHSQSHLGGYNIVSREMPSEDAFLLQQRKLRARQEAEETQPLVDEEDDEVQKLLASEIEGSLTLDEFVAHTNVAPPAKESVPSQVEAVYRDINSMIDTFGLNLRSVTAFTKGHTENAQEGGRTADDLENAEDWVLGEVEALAEVLDEDLDASLREGRVRDLDEKREACQDLVREMQRLRAKQEDLKRIIMARNDPDQVEAVRSLPLSAEQSAQQNELRGEYMNFTKLLAEAEQALTLLKTKIASVSKASGKGNTNVPTVEAIVRTINKMTTMVEKRSGDIDVLENQLRKVRLDSPAREDSPMTPLARSSILSPRESTPTRSYRHSVSLASPGQLGRATPPRKKLSGFNQEEKTGLMEKRARRQAVMGKLKDSIQKRGVNVWTMEDIE